MTNFKKTRFNSKHISSKHIKSVKISKKDIVQDSGLISVNPLTPEQVPKEFKEYDIAQSYEQAVEMGNGYPSDMPVLIVRNKDNPEDYPYSLYVKEDFGNSNATKEYRKKFIVIENGNPKFI